MPLAMASASSRSSHSMRLTTGPKTSSWAMRICGFTSLKTVGREEPAFGMGAFGEACSSGDELCAFFFCDLHVAFGGLDLLLVDLRTNLVYSSRPSPTVSDLARATSFSSEFGGDLFMQDDAAGRGAALSGCPKGSPERAFEGQVEVGVFEDDHGVLAAHL